MDRMELAKEKFVKYVDEQGKVINLDSLENEYTERIGTLVLGYSTLMGLIDKLNPTDEVKEAFDEGIRMIIEISKDATLIGFIKNMLEEGEASE